MILIIIICAILLDLLIGDPPLLPHPVVGFGKCISFLEKRWNKQPYQKQKGVLLAIVIVGLTYLVSFLIVSFAYLLHPIFGVLLEVYLIFTTIAIKGLQEAALKVAKPLLKGDLSQARIYLSWIVGRDTENLPEKEVVRGAVETTAENTVDAIIAPLFWALIGGAPLSLAYRAVNTLDSMVGYKNSRYLDFGWASARLDDVMNWFPSKITAFCIWLSAIFISPARLKQSVLITFRDSPKHPSPNSGWPEAMVAGLLGIQLGGQNHYEGKISERARMGNRERDMIPSDIFRTIHLMHGGWMMFMILLIVFYLLFFSKWGWFY
jgi:adenosylcobinamide-phosphate synthase